MAGKRQLTAFLSATEQTRWDFVFIKAPWKCKVFCAEAAQEPVGHLGWQNLKYTRRLESQITQQASWNAFHF